MTNEKKLIENSNTLLGLNKFVTKLDINHY